MHFLKNLTYLLHVNGLTRSDLSRAIDIAPSTINTWYNRSCEGIALKTLIKLSDYFGVSLDTLIKEPNIEQVYRVEKQVIKPKSFIDAELTPTEDNERLTSKEVASLKRLLAYMELTGKEGK